MTLSRSPSLFTLLKAYDYKPVRAEITGWHSLKNISAGKPEPACHSTRTLVDFHRFKIDPDARHILPGTPPIEVR